jgi:arsenate reductase
MGTAYRSGFATMLGIRFGLAIAQLADNGRYGLETVSQMKPLPTATIFHNPMCGTSRKTLEILRDEGVDVRVREYLKDPPTRDELRDIYRRAGITPREGLRAKEPIAGELGLTRPDVTDDEVLDAMVDHPILINRPLVETDKGVRLCRPQDKVREIL